MVQGRVGAPLLPDVMKVRVLVLNPLKEIIPFSLADSPHNAAECLQMMACPCCIGLFEERFEATLLSLFSSSQYSAGPSLARSVCTGSGGSPSHPHLSNTPCPSAIMHTMGFEAHGPGTPFLHFLLLLLLWLGQIPGWPVLCTVCPF